LRTKIVNCCIQVGEDQSWLPRSHCRREDGITEETALASGFFFKNDNKLFLERSSPGHCGGPFDP